MQADRAKQLGVPQGKAFLLVAAIGIGVFFGSLIPVAWAQWCKLSVVTQQTVSLIAVGGFSLISLAAESYGTLMVNMALFAAVMTWATSLCAPIAVEIAGQELVAHAYGHLYLMSTPGMLAGPPLGGEDIAVVRM